MNDRILLGTQSWNYRAWIGPFYAAGTKAADMLGFYGRVFSTIEVDATFYGTPAEPVLEAWVQQVPDTFQFSLKLPQQITHERRLIGVDEPLGRFTERIRCLGRVVGPILVQLSPDFYPTAENRGIFKLFLGKLDKEMRWAVEFRHHAWVTEDILETLERHDIALALVDGRWHRRERMLELAERPTANFAYIRWMGYGREITDFSRPQRDHTKVLQGWGRAIERLTQTVDVVYGYFNNQFEGHSPHSVRIMQRIVGQEPVDPTALHAQAELFGSAAPR